MPHKDLTVRAQYLKDRMNRLVAQGVCIQCRVNLLNGAKWRCEKCVSSNRITTSTRKRIAASKGFCTGCGLRYPVPGSKRCAVCKKYDNREARLQIYAKAKAEVYAAYGARCNCCGETEVRFLTVDHINNDGHAQRKAIGARGGLRVYQEIISQGFPPDLQILCYNCNMGKARNSGICPHGEQQKNVDWI